MLQAADVGALRRQLDGALVRNGGMDRVFRLGLTMALSLAAAYAFAQPLPILAPTP